MTMTFDDIQNFYQGVPEDGKPPPPEDTETNIMESGPVTDKPGQSHKNDNVRINEFWGLFLIPLAHGFRRKVAINRIGGMTVSYMAPDKITQLVSRTAMEKYLKNNPALELPINNFC